MKTRVIIAAVILGLAFGPALQAALWETVDQFEKGEPTSVQKDKPPYIYMEWKGRVYVHGGFFVDGVAVSEVYGRTDGKPLTEADFRLFTAPYRFTENCSNVKTTEDGDRQWACTAGNGKVVATSVSAGRRMVAFYDLGVKAPVPSASASPSPVSMHDCQTVAIEQSKRLDGAVAWKDIVAFRWTDMETGVSKGHAALIYQISRYGMVYMFDQNAGTLELGVPKSNSIDDIHALLDQRFPGIQFTDVRFQH